jgi:hypothetical protein
MSNTIQLKECKYCKEIKSRDDFPVNIMMNDHRENKCKKCKSEYLKTKNKNRREENNISHF